MTETRGVRNKNPGNIDYNQANQWQGQLGLEITSGSTKARFARFDTPENGIRALGKLLLTYYTRHNLMTVKGIINRWAPPKENDTGAYVSSVQTSVKAATGKDATGIINLRDPAALKAVVNAIIRHENSGYVYPDAVVSEGIRRVLA
jgi:hypothetical protein